MTLSVTLLKRRGDFTLDVTFESPTPGVVALFGRSGCGKSTAVDLIAGLLRADSGRIALDSEVLLDTARRIDVAAERRRIGYVFQDARLFPHLTVAANLRYAAQRARGIPFVDLPAVTRLLDIEPLLDRRTRQLSGGERQRVALGRALLTQPQLLLLDEPLAALDEARRAEVLPYLETLRDRIALPMVYVTHDFGEVLRLATHVVLIEAGRVTAQGSVAAMSLDRRLRSIIGPDQVGAIVQGTVLGVDPASRLTRVLIGHGELNIPSADHPSGTEIRLQLLARDIIVSTEAPRHLSVRNNVTGWVTDIQDDGDSDLIAIDIGGQCILARITKAATLDLALRPGIAVWALIKSVSLRGRPFAARTTTATSAGFPGA